MGHHTDPADHNNPAAPPGERLRDDLALLERRLAEIGGGADSAYEKALERAYEQMIVDHRARLAAGGG